MTEPVLEYPILTLDNKVLLDAGTRLTPQVIGDLANSGGKEAFQDCSLLKYSTITDDLVRLLSYEPYSRIFPGYKFVDDLISELQDVCLIEPVLKSMDYFKENDFYTYRHVLMVFALAALLSKDLITDSTARIGLVATGPIHDIGKTCVPLDVMKKEQPLTRSERRLMHHHAVAGYVLICYYMGDAGSLPTRVALDHHERRDGSGYPSNKILDDLMVEIIAICDVYDALIAPRPYRSVSYDNRAALDELTRMAERGQFGWEVIKALISHNRRLHNYCDCCVSKDKRGRPPGGNLHDITIDD